MVIEPLSPNPNEPPEDFLAKDYERLEQEKKRKDQEELERLLRNARREEEEAEREALREAEEAKRKALWEEQRPLREEEERKQRARLREEKIKQSRKAIAENFSFFVLLLILCSIPAFLNFIPTALTQFDELIQKLIDYLSLL